MGELATATATELAAAIRSKELSSRELLATYLDRIERLNGPVNAVVTLAVERAQAEATAADEATARGDELGPLHGLPITVKDAIETAGIRSTGGAIELTDHVPTVDAPAVARLRAAGAIVFGKTNLPRWSGDLQTFNEIFGTTNNPWDLERVPGGSSGGAATAVACGFTTFELGTDIGGSVRNPSHCCGVYGLKPSFGVVPQRGYLDHVGGGTTDADINVFGPLARSADDLDLLLGVLAGPPPEQAPAWRIDLPAPPARDLSGRRIALWLDDPACPIDAGYLAVLQRTATALEAAGAKVEDAHPPVDFAEQVGLFSALISEAITPSMPPETAQEFSGKHVDWLAHQTARAAMQQVWADWFVGWDALLCPVIPTPAFPHNQEGDFFSRTLIVNGESRSYLDNVSWAGLIGITGLPAAVPPVGPTAGGLPVGVQVVTPYLHDRAAVQLAGLIAEASGTGYRTPAGF
ncbi:MAG: amidase [Acidimicrobiaceae bacterium]